MLEVGNRMHLAWSRNTTMRQQLWVTAALCVLACNLQCKCPGLSSRVMPPT